MNQAGQWVCLCLHPGHPEIRGQTNAHTNAGPTIPVQKRRNGPVGIDFVPVCGKCVERTPNGGLKWRLPRRGAPMP